MGRGDGGGNGRGDGAGWLAVVRADGGESMTGTGTILGTCSPSSVLYKYAGRSSALSSVLVLVLVSLECAFLGDFKFV